VSVVANVAINVDSSGAVSKLRQVQTQATATQRAFGALQSAIAGIGVASIAAQTLKAAASFNDLQTRLKLLTGEYGEYTQAQQFAAKAAKQFGLSNREAATGVADIYGRLRPLGVSLKDIQSTFNGFNTIARLSGVSAEGASAAFLQLGQALGSGRLQGDEFRSIAEQVPGLLVAVSKETGIAAKDLKQFASDGKLSADIVINALKRIESEGAGKIAALVQNSDTQKFKDLQNAVDDLSVAVGNELLPVVTPLIKDLTSLVGTIAALPDPVKNATGEIVKLIAQFLLLQKAIQITIGLQTALAALTIQSNKLNVATTAGSSAFALYANNAAALAPKVAKTSALLGNLRAAMLAIPGAGWTAAAILGLGLLGKAVFDTNETFQNFVNNIGGVIASDFRSAVDGMADDARTSASNMQKAYEELPPGLSPIAKFIRELFQGAFKDTSNAAETSAAVSSNAFNDFFNGLASQGAAGFNGLSAIINNWWSNLPAPIRNIFSGNAVSMLAGAVGAAGSAASRASAPNAQATGIYGRYGAPSSQVPFAKKTPAPNAMNTPVGSTVGGGGGGRAAGGGASKAADEAKRLAEELQRSVERGNDLFRQFSRQAVLLGTTSETERKRLQIQYDYQDRVREINELKDAEQKVNLMAVNDEIRRLQTLELQTEELKKQLELFYELAGLSMGGMLPGGTGAFRTDINLDPSDRAQQKIDEYKTKLAELQDPINMAQRGAQGIGDAFSSSFQGIITGTQTAQEALASFFQNIAKSFLDMATEIIAQMVIMYAFKQLLGLFGGGGSGIGAVGNFSGAFSGTASSFNPASFGMGLLPGRAKGGPVSSGQTYMVGERGPELFVPGRSGTIVANDKMGGGSTNVVVNVDAKGSSVEGNEQGANQLGRVISAAVQSELIKQQRPGGILAR
jgi:tape measure domain-containing protein